MDNDSSRAEHWTAPVNLTPKMLSRMIGNADWGDLSRDEIAEALRIAWAEARYAYQGEASR
ncbi:MULTISPECIES: hypothetical protein [Aurantimonas]|uniref:hypothetical protein n=1 Tax=Aurantimonas TaxID=182269 RepID=UPI003512CB7E